MERKIVKGKDSLQEKKEVTKVTSGFLLAFAKKIELTQANTSFSVNSLVKKGILMKAESEIEGNNTKASSLFVNPYIIYAGDKDNINEALLKSRFIDPDLKATAFFKNFVFAELFSARMFFRQSDRQKVRRRNKDFSEA
ncbi:hypothetical protein [Bacillus toyonensis]|uniref:hypothetical protein n=1 Tax=Bacillus toyonensis TaxID=155322 RepID=UPI0020D27EF4|nr:hypothetical protein [Bacillus toyonensis]